MALTKKHPGQISKIKAPNYGRNVNEDLLNESSEGQGMWKLLARHDSYNGQEVGSRDQACCGGNMCASGSCGWSGFLMIPEECRGVYDRYLIKGSTNCYEQYCSRLDLYFAGQGSPSAGNCQHGEHTCCTVNFCGRFTTTCNRSCFQCAGSIPWIQGCDSGYETACTSCGFGWDTEIIARPSGHECQGNMFFLNHRRTTGCEHNHYDMQGWGDICCCANPKCLKGVWYTTPSDVIDVYGSSVVEIYGYNDNFKKERDTDIDGYINDEVRGESKRQKQLYDHSNCDTKHCIDPKYKK